VVTSSDRWVVEMASVATTEAATGTAATQTLDDHVIVLFGATGDLAMRKLLPGMFHLAQEGLMPERFRIVGTSRTELADEQFRRLARSAVDESGRKPATTEAWESFAARLSYVGSNEGGGALGGAVADAKQEIGTDARLLHYLSVPPGASASIVEELCRLGLNEGARVVMEKPFGTDLTSARDLNAGVHRAFDESQVFRIDHYLGKEAVQNLLAVRFANGMFEPTWNRDHIDHVQIDVPETLSIEMRAGFYEGTGAFRDMVVTHLFQVLGFVAMEPPKSLEPEDLVAEKLEVFDSMPPLDPRNVVRGQYRGYRDQIGVAPDSGTETFVALRAFVDNPRWAGVPFYLRTGKRLAESGHLLTLAFKQPPRRMFPLDCHHAAESFGSDHFTFELGDPGRISSRFLAKVPGPSMRLGEAHMNFSYADAFGGPSQALEAYERLLHDVMIGDRMLFTTAHGIERLWEVSAPVLESPPPLQTYEPGSWGPDAIRDLIAPHRWHLPGAHVQ
jgi:glucose-6-phosphate 1-dehydrogenase